MHAAVNTLNKRRRYAVRFHYAARTRVKAEEKEKSEQCYA
jgi:hypothetical protein